MASHIELVQTLGIPAEEILSKKHNLWVGVSDSHWFHEPDRLEATVRWALEHTKQELLIWIPGRMYSSNYHHIDKMSRAKALRQGFAVEDQFRARIDLLLKNDLAADCHRIRVIGYDELLTPDFVRRRSLFYRSFSEEGAFYHRLMEVAEDFLRARQRTISKERVEAAAVYQLQELPIFLAPAQPIGSDRTYAAEIYPGMGKFDRLVRDLVEGSVFPELTEQLKLTEPCGIVEVKWVG